MEDIYAYVPLTPKLTTSPLLEKGTLIETAVTDASGQVLFNADLPVYYGFEVRELKAPKGYASTDYVHSFRYE